jgi:hypothetical protein
MKRIVLSILTILLALPVAAWAVGESTMMPKTQVRILFNGKEARVTMVDNATARDFLALLPLTVTLEDYANSEKINYLPRKLTTTGGQNAEQVKDDFCYYAPWGNLAIFYMGFGYGTSLYVLGSIESGKEELATMGKSFTATIELIR